MSTSSAKHIDPIALKLVFGSWKQQFTEIRRKLIIAEALNACVYKDKLAIRGYLITSKTVYLVLTIEATQLNRMLALFYEKVRKELRQQQESIALNEQWTTSGFAASTELFTRFPLHDLSLIALLTGTAIKLPYYDPHIQRMTDQVQQAEFCSVIDYSGAKGPVIVSRKHHEHIENTKPL